MMRRFLLLALAPLLVPACGSDSSGSSGSSGTSGGVECNFSGTLSGGLTGSIQVSGCGTTTSATFSVAQSDFTAGTSLGVQFVLVTALQGGEVGTLPLERLEVFKREGKGTEAKSLVWSSTSCTLTLDKNVASPTTVFKNRFLLTGHGSCPAPLEPKAPNTGPAVTVSPFEMTAFIDPR